MYNKVDLLYKAIIYSANEKEDLKIEDGYEFMKKTWFFMNSDRAYYNGEEIEPFKRSLCVNPIIVGKPEWEEFYNAEVTYSSTINNLEIPESDFIDDMLIWIKKQLESETIGRKRKMLEFEKYLNQYKLKRKPKITKFKWFDIGLEFARGTVYQVYNSNKDISFLELAIKLGYSSTLRNYFSSTYNENKGDPKNIFDNPKKMNVIMEHCLKEGLNIHPKFKKAFDKLQTN